MAKNNIQIMLTKNVNKLGKLGDLVQVAPGYARNYLFPQGMAIIATRGVINEVERRKEAERQRLIAIRQEAESKKVALGTIGGFTFKKKAEGGSIFGTVTDREVAQLVAAKTMMEFDSRDITVPDINKLGTYDVQIKLHAEVTATIKVEVIAE
ncbi:MAG: 50S ribosomal protein L9 [Oscillatoriales cyanobacterium SM2_2_1]|nr:50S ribosomal protein L9 [Oscillatoriales cyanobacterium SM2_2_1]